MSKNAGVQTWVPHFWLVKERIFTFIDLEDWVSPELPNGMVVTVVLLRQVIYPKSQRCFAAKLVSTGGVVIVLGLAMLL